jgi:hypothetical protein
LHQVLFIIESKSLCPCGFAFVAETGLVGPEQLSQVNGIRKAAVIGAKE